MIARSFRYTEQRVAAVRKVPLTADKLAVLTGAAVSPACHDMMKQLPECTSLCPWCSDPNVLATWEHVVWQCPAAPRPAINAESCYDDAQARLGWPAGQDPPFDEVVIEWLALVRAKCLQLRYPNN